MTSVSGSGGMQFISWVEQISHTLPTTHHCCNLMCGPWCKVTEMGTAHSWHLKGY